MIQLLIGNGQGCENADGIVKEVNKRDLKVGLFNRLFKSLNLRDVGIGYVFLKESIENLQPIETLYAVTKRKASGKTSLKIIENCLLAIIHTAHHSHRKKIIIPVLGEKNVPMNELIKLYYRLLQPDQATYIIATLNPEIIRLMKVRAMIDNVMMPLIKQNANYKLQ